MRFRFKAQKSSGEFYEGEQEAADKFALARELKTAGETPISAVEAKTRGPLGSVLRFDSFARRIPMHEKIVFIRNLAGMLGSGLSLSRSLAVLERQTRRVKFKRVIAEVAARISKGESLSQALAVRATIFPPLVVSMVRAGEESGGLSASLLAIAEQLDRTYMLERKVRGALMYPSVIFFVMVVVGVAMLIFVVPQLTASFKDFNVELPLTTRIVIATSDFLHMHLFTGLAAAAAIVFGGLVAAKSTQGKRGIDYALLHIPVVTPLVREANAARTARTLSSLLSAGVEVVGALQITADVLSNSLYREVLLASRDAIQRGEPMSGAFREREDIFPPFLSEMVAVGEETGKLSPMLKDASVFFEAEVEQKTRDLSTAIEPALMVIVGVIVGFFSVAMISPAYSLMNSI
jgi:type IV pilus assembly protein PilC